MKRISFKKGWLFSLLMMVVFCSSCFSQQKKSDTLQIKTSAVCGQCKDRIEGVLAFEKGVKSSSLDIETKVLTVIYNPAKTTPEKLRITVSKIGYDADNVPANEAAYVKLPACCKKDAPKH